MRREFFRPAPRSVWTVVSFAPQNFPLSDVEQSVNKLRDCCQRLGEHPYRFLLQSLTLLPGMGKPATGLWAVLEFNFLKRLTSLAAEQHPLLVEWRGYVCFLTEVQYTRSLM
jgi:hypothetical protein